MLAERQLSSTRCSTSYDVAQVILRNYRPRLGRCGVRARCAVQSRSYRGPPLPERDSSRKHAPSHRAWGHVAASAAAMAPPSNPRDGVAPLPSDLATSIPDAIPCLEDLEDLRDRAMQVSRTPAYAMARSTTLGAASDPRRLGGGRKAAMPQRSAAAADSHPFPESREAALSASGSHSLDPPRGARGGSLVANALPPSPSAPSAAGRSALSQAVPPPFSHPQRPQQPVRDPVAGTASLRVGTPPNHRSSFARRLAAGEQQSHVMQLTMRIKGVQDWRQLPVVLADAAAGPGGLDPFNAAAFLTHLAQRVASAPPSSPSDVALIERMQASVLAVVEDNMHEYRARQVSNLSWALARLGLPSGAAFLRDHLLAAAYPLLPWYEPQHLSNTLWALAAAGVAPDDGWLEEYLTAAFVGLQRRAFQPQHLANMIWALERLGVMPDQEWMAAYYDCAEAAAHLANGQDCSNILISLAQLGMHEQSPQSTAALADRLTARLQELLVAGTKADGSSSNTPTTVRSSSSSSSATSSSAQLVDAAVLTPTPARLAASTGADLEAPEARAVAAAGASTWPSSSAAVSDQSVANSLWALALMCRPPSAGLWEAVAVALRLRLSDPSRPAPGVHPAALAILLWAANSVGHALPPAVMGLVYRRVRSAEMQAMEPRNLATMVWAVATAPPEQARPPPDWVSETVTVSLGSVPQLSAQSVSNMLYGLHQLGARPAPVWMSAIINHFHRNLADEASGQSVSNVLWCLSKMGYRLNDEGMEILFGLVTSRLSAWNQQLLQHLERQGRQQQHRGPSTLPSAVAEERRRGATASQGPAGGLQLQQPPTLPEPPFNAQELSNVSYAIASMGYSTDPDGQLATLLLTATGHRLREANAAELSNIMWSFATLKIRPPDAWVDNFCTAAEACLPSFKPRDLAQTLYGAAKLRLPLQLAPQQPPHPRPPVLRPGRGPQVQPAPAAGLPVPQAPAPAAQPQRAQPSPSAPGGQLQRPALPASALLAPPPRPPQPTQAPPATPPQPPTSLSIQAPQRRKAERGTASPSPAPSRAVASWMAAALAAAPRLVANGSAQDLCNLSWALVQLGVPVTHGSPLASAFAARLVSLGSRAEPALLALGVWALGKWRVRPTRAQMDQLEVATYRQMQSMRPHELAALLSGFTALGHTPPPEWLEEAMQFIAARGREFGPQDWTVVLHALSRVQDEDVVKPGLQELVQRLTARLDALPLPSLVLLAFSCGCMGPSRTARGLVARVVALLAAGGSDPRGMAAAMRVAAHAAATSKAVEAEEARPVELSSLTPAELSAVLWSAVRVGLKVLPRDFRNQFHSHTVSLIPELPASLVASYLWAAGRLRMWLPGHWRTQLLLRTARVVEDMRGRELAMCLAGLMWLRVWPSLALLTKLRKCLSARRHEMHEKLGQHADMALRVLGRRWWRALVREQQGRPLRLWLEHVKTGNKAATAAGKGRPQRPRPKRYITRRRALKRGVLRRRSVWVSTEASQKGASEIVQKQRQQRQQEQQEPERQ